MWSKLIIFFIITFLFSTFVFALDIESELSIAKHYIAKKDYKTAKTFLESLLPRKCNNNIKSQINFLLSKCSEKINSTNQYYRTILELPENDYSEIARINLAKNLIFQKKLNKAQKLLNKIQENRLSQYYEESLFWLAQIYFINTHYTSAINFYKQYLAFGEDNTKIELAMLNMGTAYFQIKDYYSSLKTYERLKNAHSKKNFKSFLLYMLGLCSEKVFKYEKTIEYYKEVINKYPYSKQKPLAEKRIVDLAERGLYKPSKKLPDVEIKMEKNFIVQLGAFLRKKQAESAQQSFEKKGHNTFLFEKLVKGKKYYCVGIGPYRTSAEAKYKKKKLKRSGIDCFVYEKP